MTVVLLPHNPDICNMKNIIRMTIQEKVGKTIIKLRKEKGMSQETFAYESGIDRRYMSDIENGKRNISLDILERVADKLGIKLSEFFLEVENTNE